MAASDAGAAAWRGGWDWDGLRAAFAPGLMVTSTRADGFSARTAEGVPVHVDQTRGQVVPWLVLRVPVCEQHELDPERVLERNGTLGFTTLVLLQGGYWLRLALPFDSVELRDPLHLVGLCLEAARLLSPARVEPATGARAQVHFAHYAE
jgi:hypothetical protein